MTSSEGGSSWSWVAGEEALMAHGTMAATAVGVPRLPTRAGGSAQAGSMLWWDRWDRDDGGCEDGSGSVTNDDGRRLERGVAKETPAAWEEDGAFAPMVTRRESSGGVAREGEEEGWDRMTGGSGSGKAYPLARCSQRIVRSPGGDDTTPPAPRKKERKQVGET